MISDTSPLIFLSKIGKLELLKELFIKIKITNAVKEEIFIEGKTGSEAIGNAIESGWIIIESPKKEISFGFGPGEQTAISLAVENKDSLIIDDALAIKAAKSFDVNVLRTTSIIFLALSKNLINKKEALSLLNKLIENGYYISPKYYALIIEKLSK